MKFDITVLLDSSGSMMDRKKDHIGGLRSFITDQKGQGETVFTLIEFDTGNPFKIIFDGVDIESVDVDKVNLVPAGGTPLLDSLGKTIAHVENRIKGKENETQAVLMIITDGEENSSKEWKKVAIQKAIKDKENDWKILYLGANVDAFEEASNIGILQGAAINVANTSKGIDNSYFVNTSKLNNMRNSYARGLNKMEVLGDAGSNYTQEDRALCAADDSIVNVDFDIKK